ncbi:hypothetical protein B0A54_17761 [Friedmanniomyces endolithicus]|uniref:Ribosomal protein mS38 C-terminal domain-containing protein n=1 Tax=Friedmanniomyces endolithicus TaxID=329885 RepID=A0A4U0TT50_9PEZI|nr:hypothetical protein B0A54_17761 [Friedmanniomyces endolithicus]
MALLDGTAFSLASSGTSKRTLQPCQPLATSNAPLSVTTTIPPPSTTEAFNAIFDSHQHREDQWAHGDSARGSPEDVIYTLHNTIESLENSSHAAAAQDEGVRLEVLQESPSNSETSIKHLDSSPRSARSLEEIPRTTTSSPRSRKASTTPQVQAKGTRSSTKTYQTTITVHEVTETNGQKHYSALSSPLISLNASPGTPPTSHNPRPSRTTRLPVTHASHPQHALHPRGVQQPFRHRMQRRVRMDLHTRIPTTSTQVGEPGQEVVRERFVRRAPSEKRVSIILLSVKRQRKMKMKKHKYKKLMKRTRNLRGRLDRN